MTQGENPFAAPRATASTAVEGAPSDGINAVPWDAASYTRMLTLFRWFHWPSIACLLIGLVLVVIGFVKLIASMSSNFRTGPDPGSQAFQDMLIWLVPGYGLLFIGWALGIAAVVFACILLYRLWSLVERDGGPTTPGKAVGFLFIPFFNFYWIFVAFRGLGVELDRVGGPRGIPSMVGIGTACSILAVCTCVPYLGILALLPAAIVVHIMLGRYTAAAVRLIGTLEGRA